MTLFPAAEKDVLVEFKRSCGGKSVMRIRLYPLFDHPTSSLLIVMEPRRRPLFESLTDLMLEWRQAVTTLHVVHVPYSMMVWEQGRESRMLSLLTLTRKGEPVREPLLTMGCFGVRMRESAERWKGPLKMLGFAQTSIALSYSAN